MEANRFKSWREKLANKTDVEKHNFAFKIATVFTIGIVIIVLINIYLNFFGALPENRFMTKLGESGDQLKGMFKNK